MQKLPEQALHVENLAELCGGTWSVQASYSFEEQTGTGAGISAGSAFFKNNQAFDIQQIAAGGSTLAETERTEAR